MKKALLAGLIVTFVGSQSVNAALKCEDLYSKTDATHESAGANKSSSSGNSLVSERDTLQAHLKSLASSGAAVSKITPTPLNREVSMFVSYGSSGSDRHDGRILRVQLGSHGGAEIVFARKDYNGDYGKEEIIPVSKISIDSVSIKKILNSEEKQFIVAQLENSIQTGMHIEFTSQFGQLQNEKGRVVELKTGNDGSISGFVLAEDNGSEVMQSISSVDPSSIRLFRVKPRAIDASESLLVSQIKAAFEDGRYVSFSVKSKNGGQYRYEGWVTDLNLGTDGEYIFKLNEDKFEEGAGSTKLRLADISAGSFVGKPSLRVREAVGVELNGHAAAKVDGYLESNRNGSRMQVTITKNLQSELSAFADSNQISGQRLPDEIGDLVQLGSELRLYFRSGERRIRLTIRHANDGAWSFGDTAFDRTAVNESYVDKYSGTRYTTNESSRLEGQRFVGRLPAARLRYHLQTIRNSLLQEQVSDQFQSVKSEWAKSIPEDVTKSEVMNLLMAFEGVSFYLDRGFVKEPQAPLTEAQNKKLAAIKYLIANHLVFWSYNAGASNIKMGIYPRDSVKPSRMYLTAYDFGKSLNESMEGAGFEYVNGVWNKK